MKDLKILLNATFPAKIEKHRFIGLKDIIENEDQFSSALINSLFKIRKKIIRTANARQTVSKNMIFKELPMINANRIEDYE